MGIAENAIYEIVVPQITPATPIRLVIQIFSTNAPAAISEAQIT
jgi:hypothetical protein